MLNETWLDLIFLLFQSLKVHYPFSDLIWALCPQAFLHNFLLNKEVGENCSFTLQATEDHSSCIVKCCLLPLLHDYVITDSTPQREMEKMQKQHWIVLLELPVALQSLVKYELQR